MTFILGTALVWLDDLGAIEVRLLVALVLAGDLIAVDHTVDAHAVLHARVRGLHLLAILVQFLQMTTHTLDIEFELTLLI